MLRHLRDKQHTPLEADGPPADRRAAAGWRGCGSSWERSAGSSLPARRWPRLGRPAAARRLRGRGARARRSLAGELPERYLFFTAVVRPKMPGGLAP